MVYEHEHGHEHGPVGDLSRIEAIRDRGVHRAGEHEGPFSLHVVGLGKAGANVIERLVSDPPEGFLSDPRTSFSALAIDIGDQELRPIRESAGRLPADRAQVRTVALPILDRASLFGGLRRYREFLKMEYPRYYWNPNYEPWLPSDIPLPAAGEHFPRALAKAIYGVEYYQGRAVAEELDAFARRVAASEAMPIVCVIFGLAGGTGSGIVVELARHLSNIKLGRRAWVLGVGILPCEGDPDYTRDGVFFPAINELDCMVDAEKNKGVMAVWGDLYKNPFTAGFFAVPQNVVYDHTGDLAATHERIDAGLAAFLARDNSTHLYETLKLLNWLNVPADRWHPAVRAEQGERWLNLLAVGFDDAQPLGGLDLAGPVSSDYAEARLFGPAETLTEQRAARVREETAKTVKTAVEPGALTFPSTGQAETTLFVPHVSKLDLAAFVPAREAYDRLDWDEKLLRHSWLLDLGVLLCEPSTRFEGMGGECILGCACWVVVPHAAIRGEINPAVRV
ncbi:hypothetical protein C3Y87_13290 [Carbonactinospora thermoautotrophica]|uniref:tubulin-like doman-containing protein n=1 Tax=Carbonactinospora thermoautotrophica TaxID=1469144 RepID=UPI00226FE3FF|nr:tubulin-like doman-containing protein [Carbonactinospora thermoautotrophica]MCX9192366.1 hypothetical protein [Carbonactinospora thermoautotrophica]